MTTTDQPNDFDIIDLDGLADLIHTVIDIATDLNAMIDKAETYEEAPDGYCTVCMSPSDQTHNGEDYCQTHYEERIYREVNY